MTAKLPDAGTLLEAQRAAESSARTANAAYRYALQLNRRWIDLWDSYLDDYLDPPKRFVNAQTAFIEQAFDRERPGAYPAEPCAVLHLAPSRPMVLGALAW